MKKQLIFCLAFLLLSLTACEETMTQPNLHRSEAILAIESIFPENLVRGSEIIIAGKNFGADILDNYVTINGQWAEVTYVEAGKRIVAIVPNNLTPGEHMLSLSAKGQNCTKTCFIVGDN